MKKWFAKYIVTILLIVMVPMMSEAAGVTFNLEDLNLGIVHISYKSSRPLKVMITKGEGRYTYDLRNDGKVETYPLQMGNGSYKIDVLQNVGGTRYSYVKSKTLKLAMEDPNSVFLNSIQEINWNTEDQPILKSRELIGALEEEGKKANLIYEYIIKNYTYDYDKIPTLTAAYKPNIVQTFLEKKGICYDYSSLLAAMKRSDGIPTKLVKGYTKHVDGYHAWNEVYINGEWVIVDSTVDAAYLSGGVPFDMVKDPDEFTKVYEY